MSVTFTVHPMPRADVAEIGTWCRLGDVTVPVEIAQAIADEHTDTCVECAGYDGPLVTSVLPFDEVNMANANAAEVLDLVGITGDDVYAGSADAEDLLGKLLVAEALLAESPARPYQEQREAGRATLVDVGRRAGYLNERIEQLADLASWAAANGRRVVWG
jgi:hypothetical protein